MNEFITKIWIIILLNSLQYIHLPYFTTEFNIMNSEHWILVYFSVMNSHYGFIIMKSNSYYEFIIMKSKSWIQIEYNEFLYLNSYIYEFIYEFRIITFESIYMNSYTREFICSFHIWIQMYMSSYNHFIYEFI